MPKNDNLSRTKVKQWLAKYPRSPWWIHNARLADFCGIQHEGDLHNTAILGKYMPRGQVLGTVARFEFKITQNNDS